MNTKVIGIEDPKLNNELTVTYECVKAFYRETYESLPDGGNFALTNLGVFLHKPHRPRCDYEEHVVALNVAVPFGAPEWGAEHRGGIVFYIPAPPPFNQDSAYIGLAKYGTVKSEEIERAVTAYVVGVSKWITERNAIFTDAAEQFAGC